jgi:hypothetical protein
MMTSKNMEAVYGLLRNHCGFIDGRITHERSGALAE